MKNKKITTILFSLLALVTFAISCSDSDSGNSNCPTKTCGDFKIQSEAQAAFNSDKTCYKNLDGDGNGKACESLK